MSIRINILAALVVCCLLSSAEAVTVSFQNGVNGYTSQQSVGWNGNPTTTAGPPSATLPGHQPYANGALHAGRGYIDSIYDGSGITRHYTQVIRFDDVFGAGLGQIPDQPNGIIIDSATLTLNLDPTLTGAGDTSIYRAYRVLVDWSEGDLGVNFGPRDNALGKPQGPDLVTPGEVTSTYLSSAPTNNRVITFDLTSDLQYFLENPSDRYGWAFGKTPNLTGGPIFLDHTIYTTGVVPLLEVSFSVIPVPEPSSFLLMALGMFGMVRYARGRSNK